MNLNSNDTKVLPSRPYLVLAKTRFSHSLSLVDIFIADILLIGFGNLTQGHMDVYVLKNALMLWSDESGGINLNSFVEHFFVLLDVNSDSEAMKADLEIRKIKVCS